MADIAARAPALQMTAPLVTLTALYVLAFSMKAAAFPVNFWLPASYHTPRIVVSALFAGLLTKVGIYALIRIGVMLFPAEREQLSLALAVAAALTMLTGSLGALAQSDTRRLLGYLVISGIGAMLAGIAIGGADAIGGVIVYAVHSMLVMTALYLAIGLGRPLERRLLAACGRRALSPVAAVCGAVADAVLLGLRPAAIFGLLAEGHAGPGRDRWRFFLAGGDPARLWLPHHDCHGTRLSARLLASRARARPLPCLLRLPPCCRLLP